LVRRDGERGKVAPDKNSFSKPIAADVGLSRKEIHKSARLGTQKSAAGGFALTLIRAPAKRSRRTLTADFNLQSGLGH